MNKYYILKMQKLNKIILMALLLSFFSVITFIYAEEDTTNSFIKYFTRIEANYIVACQYNNPSDPAHGAINNIFGNPTWVVPRENAMAILGLIEAARVLRDNRYLEKAQLAASYLVSVQDQSDGAWYDQYDYVTPVVLSKSPTQTAEVMIALYKLGFNPQRYHAMESGARYLMSCQDVANKGGQDDGLICGGKDTQGQYYSWRWTSDNSYAYWALKAAEGWAFENFDFSFANECRQAAEAIIDGINTYLYAGDNNDPDYGVWRRVVDEWDQPINPSFHEWINYAPQMLDLPAEGVGSMAVGEWIHEVLQTEDGACVWDDGEFNNRKSPGFSFQASLCWIDLGQTDYADAARKWVSKSGLWQRLADPNGVRGGWIDWVQDDQQANWWERFIDTSFYAIAVFNGGYDFRTLDNILDNH